MVRPLLLCSLAAALIVSTTAVTQVSAAKPSDRLLPDTTKSYVSVADVDALIEHFNEMQIGKLVQDPVMKPFVDDLRRQIREKLDQTSVRLGIGWADLDGVYGGEVAAALVQPWDASTVPARIEAAGAKAAAKAKQEGQKAELIELAKAEAMDKAAKELDIERRQQGATVLLVNVTGHNTEANELLAKVARNQREQGAEQSTIQIAGVDVVALTFPKKDGQEVARRAFYCIHQDQLIAVDRQDVVASILARFDNPGDHTLASAEPYIASMENAQAAFGDLTPHIRWFIEPFGFAEVSRAYNGGRKRRGTDLLRVLQNQGFTAVQGLGGYIALKTEEHDLRHHTLVYAPAVKREPGAIGQTKYDRAARMLDFPNSADLKPQPWIPRGLAMHLTFNWKMENAFWYAETLVNEIAGDDVFDDVIENLELDPHGPQINAKEEFTRFLGERATLISDYRMPIGPKSERILVAIEVTDAATVMATVNKAMENDPAAKKREHNGQVIWELLNDEEPVAELKIEGFDGGFGFDTPAEVEEEEEERFIPNSAVSVANGHLLLSSHVDYIAEVLDRPAPADTLASAADYQAVVDALVALGAGDDSFHLFTRTDEAYRVTYELLRQGKMPESESVLGKLLNRMFTPEDAADDELRQQQLDGSKLPEFQVVRRYLGPTGFYVRTVDEGWTITGCLLTKEMQ